MPLLFLNLNKIFTISILITAIIVIIGGDYIKISLYDEMKIARVPCA